MTVHDYIKYWFENKRESQDDVDEVVDGFFGYLAACGLDIVSVAKCSHANVSSVKRMLGRKVYIDSYCNDCKERIRERV